MFEKIKDFFMGDASIAIDKSGTPTEGDIQISTCILLLRMAAADNEVAQEELATIVDDLQRQFDLPQDQVDQLMEMSSALNWQSEKVDEFIQVLNSKFDESQRRLILALVWKVVIADGKVDAFERKFASELAAQLLLDDKEARRAKEMAQQGDV